MAWEADRTTCFALTIDFSTEVCASTRAIHSRQQQRRFVVSPIRTLEQLRAEVPDVAITQWEQWSA